MSHDTRIHQQRSLFDAFYRVTDACAILVALWICAGLAFGQGRETYLLLGVAAVVVYYVFAELTGMYRNWRGTKAEREILCGVATWLGALLSTVLLGYAFGFSLTIPKPALLLWLTTTPATITVFRALIRGFQRLLRRRGINTRGFAIVGINDLGLRLARNIEDAPELGLRLAGFYDDRPADRTGDVPSEVGDRIGNVDELIEKARDGEVDMIYITFPMRAEERIRSVLNRLADSTASVYVVPDFFVFELLHSRWSNIGGLPAVSVFENPFYGVDGVAKRLFDFVMASAALLVAAIPMLILAAMIKWSSPGPVFFRQKRYGLDGKEIMVWKFRSMTVCENDKVTQATKNDSRVTRLGRILRKTSLDELPQLFNVLAGSMSLVGPRPHANAHNEQYRGLIQGYMLRHKVKPGITGLAQVSGYRGETDTVDKMEKRVEYDHRYIREWSVWLDLKILFKTAFVAWSQKNAY